MKVFVDTLRPLLQARGISDVPVTDVDSAETDAVIEGDFLDLTNGSRSARFWVGFGAGKSKCHVRLTGRSLGGGVLFTAEHERISAAGLSKDELAENVTEVARDLGQALASNRGVCSQRKELGVASAAQADAGKGLVTIESNPGDAAVYLDGDLIGMTPLPRYPIPAGRVRLSFARRDFDPWRSNLKVSAGAESRIAVELEPSTTPESSPSPGSPPPTNPQ